MSDLLEQMFGKPRPTPDVAGDGQESVWDYPRPPRIEATSSLLRIEHGGTLVAATSQAQRVLETSHPPTYYFPFEAVNEALLRRNARETLCEWKGRATHWDVVVGDEVLVGAAWSYPNPSPGSGLVPGAIAFYAGPFDSVTVDGERVTPQAGPFYGGWITSRVVGPFKGGPGTRGW